MHKQRVGWPRGCRALEIALGRVRCTSLVKRHARPHGIRTACTSAWHTQAGQCMQCKLLVDAQPSHFKINSSTVNPRAITSAGESASDNDPLAMINGLRVAHCQLFFVCYFSDARPVWSSSLRRWELITVELATVTNYRLAACWFQLHCCISLMVTVSTGLLDHKLWSKVYVTPVHSVFRSA